VVKDILPIKVNKFVFFMCVSALETT